MMIMRSQSGVPGGAGVPGGQIGMFQLAKAIARLHIDVELFVGGPRMPYASGLDDVTVTYFRWPLWLDRLIADNTSFLRALGTNLRRHRWLDALAALPGVRSADVIHIQGLEDGAALLSRFSGPIVVTHWGRVGRWLPRGLNPDDDEALQRRIQQIRDNVRLVAIGHAQGEALTSAGMPPTDVIPPGIDLKHFRPCDRGEARQRVGLPTDIKVVLFVGRFAADKNVGALLTAFSHLAARSHRTKLVIIGNGPLRRDLQRLSRALGIEESTIFLSFVPHQDLPSYYQAADVTVVPSNYLETFCMVALEAIACGCPLIVTEHVPEILRSFPAVPAVASDDIQALREQLDAALHGEVHQVDTRAIAEYDWSNIGRRYIGLYQTAQRSYSL